MSITNTPEAPAVAETAKVETLTLQDMVLMAQVVQLASSRGTFRAEELSSVGGMYERLLSFLEASGAITRQQPTKDQAPAETPAEETTSDQEKTND